MWLSPSVSTDYVLDFELIALLNVSIYELTQ